MARYIPERSDVMTKMERDQNESRFGELREDEILQGLIDKYHPSWRELRRIRNPLGSFTSVPGNEKLLISDKTTRKEVVQFNRDQNLGQEIGAVREDWNTINGTRKVWVYVLLIIPQDVKGADNRAGRQETGIKAKRKRLASILRNPNVYRKRADAVRKEFEIAIKKGRRRGGAGVT